MNPFFCTTCNYVNEEGKEEHRCNPKLQRVSFYSRRYSSCVWCIFNRDNCCQADVIKRDIKTKQTDFRESCKFKYWLPVIFKCRYCNTTRFDEKGETYCDECDKYSEDKNDIPKKHKKEIETISSYDAIRPQSTPNEKPNSRVLMRDPSSIKTVKKTPVPKNELVIAKFNENLDWINHIPPNIELITIYNKGYEISLKNIPQNVEIIELENIGREADTWLYHFISRRNCLADTTFLAQADPFTHSPYYLELITKKYNKPQSLTIHYIVKNSFKKLSNEKILRDTDLTEYVDGIEVRLGNLEYQPLGFSKHVTLAWDIIFENPVPDKIYHGYGAMYALPNESILNRSNDFYKSLISSNLTAHQMEGLWDCIFNAKKEYGIRDGD